MHLIWESVRKYSQLEKFVYHFSNNNNNNDDDDDDDDNNNNNNDDDDDDDDVDNDSNKLLFDEHKKSSFKEGHPCLDWIGWKFGEKSGLKQRFRKSSSRVLSDFYYELQLG